MLVAVINKGLSHMTAMAVKDKEPAISPAPRFLLRVDSENRSNLLNNPASVVMMQQFHSYGVCIDRRNYVHSMPIAVWLERMIFGHSMGGVEASSDGQLGTKGRMKEKRGMMT